jgi:hypothetical protein
MAGDGKNARKTARTNARLLDLIFFMVHSSSKKTCLRSVARYVPVLVFLVFLEWE